MAYSKRSEEGEARRIASLRTPEARSNMSDSKKGKRPKNFLEAQRKSWAASRKEVLTYSGIHAWVRRNWGKAFRCDICGKENLSGRSVHWANKDHKYSRDRSDWMMACRPCHADYDQKHNEVSFANNRRFVTHCPKGHEYTTENTRIFKGQRGCKQCAKEKHLATYTKRPRKIKTHCKQGHEYTPENTYTYQGCRECVQCRAERVRNWKYTHKG